MARRGRSVEKERFWRDVVRGHRISGLTIRAFCKREGLSEPSFHWWRRELARRSAAPTARGRGSAMRTTSRRDSPRFLPIAVAPLSAGPAYEVVLPSGMRVLVHASAGEKLAAVLAALEPWRC